jgi:hypothetical protein
MAQWPGGDINMRPPNEGMISDVLWEAIMSGFFVNNRTEFARWLWEEMTYTDPEHQLPQYAASLDTPGRRLGLCIADTIIEFYVTAARAIVEAITSLATGNVPTTQGPVIHAGFTVPEKQRWLK